VKTFLCVDPLGSVKALEKTGFQLIEEKKRQAFGRVCLCRKYFYDKRP